MPTRRRSLTAAAFGALLLTVLAAPLGAQETNTVGPPQLKDFQLPGQRTTPPAPQPEPAPTPPAQTPPPAQTRPPAPAAEAPRREPARPASPAGERTPAPAATAETPRAEAPSTDAPLAEPIPQDLPPQAAPPAVAPSPAPRASAPLPAAEPARSWTWLYFAVPAALGLIAFFAIGRRRRVRRPDERIDHGSTLGVPEAEPEAERPPEQAPAPEPAPAPRPAPVARPAPAAAPVARAAEQGPRAWLEIDLRPDKAAATATEAVVHYELVLRNIGAVPARNIRIDTKLFNASEEPEMNAFFIGPIHEASGSPHIVIDPGSGLFLVGQVAMPKESVREVRVQDRTLFIPLVAMNVAYDWQGEDGAVAGTGRTSKSWLVGQQPQSEEAKMGAFRLDLGPRIYRQVAGREAKLVKV